MLILNRNRLHLAHNLLRSIAYEFSNCFALKYLNMRDNRLKEIPKAVSWRPKISNVHFSNTKADLRSPADGDS